jgi:hypothetical protein
LAVTELAVCLPLLTLLVFGSIQACNLIYLKHAITSAAYEGTLEMAKENATNASVETRAQQVLDARGVTSTDIKVLPVGADVAASPRGMPLMIDIDVEVGPNLSLSGFFPSPDRLSVRVTGSR